MNTRYLLARTFPELVRWCARCGRGYVLVDTWDQRYCSLTCQHRAQSKRRRQQARAQQQQRGAA